MFERLSRTDSFEFVIQESLLPRAAARPVVAGQGQYMRRKRLSTKDTKSCNKIRKEIDTVQTLARQLEVVVRTPVGQITEARDLLSS
jgi:hypothetical protein